MSVSTDSKRILKGCAIGIAAAAAVCGLLACAFAFILNMMSGLPYGIIDYVMIGIMGVSVLIGAYIAAAIARSRGLITGLIVGGIVLLLTFAVGLSMPDNDIGLMTIIRAVVLLVCGALGGIKGVNRKEKIRIH